MTLKLDKKPKMTEETYAYLHDQPMFLCRRKLLSYNDDEKLRECLDRIYDKEWAEADENWGKK